METKKKWGKHPSAAARDWSIAAWAAVDIAKKLGPGLATFGVVFTVMAALLIYALVVKFWVWIAVALLIYFGGRLIRKHRDTHRPVPWDDNYNPRRDDDDIPY